MNVKMFIKKNKYSLLFLLFLLTVVVSISASFTMSKYTRTVQVHLLEIEVIDEPPVLYRGFATVNPENRGMDGVTGIVIGSFNKYKDELGLTDEDWKNREPAYWVQQESASNPEGADLRGGIRLFFKNEEIEGVTQKVAYVLAKKDYPVVFPIESHGMFQDLHGLKSIAFEEIDTSHVRNMQLMFYGCYALSTLDVKKFDTANVTNMSAMFSECHALTSLNMSSFNTQNVINMASMFQSCQSLSEISVTNFITDNVTSMCQMFIFCGKLSSLDLSSFDTANVTDMGEMFNGCWSLKTIYAGSGWNTDKVTSSEKMFGDPVTGVCGNLKGGEKTSCNTEMVLDKTYARIDGGTSDPGYFTAK